MGKLLDRNIKFSERISSKRVIAFEEMLNSLVDAYERIKSRQYGYIGPLLTSDVMLQTSLNLDMQFSEDVVKACMEDKRITPLKLALSAALRLGIQQGIYLCSDRPFMFLEIEDFEEFTLQLQELRKFEAFQHSFVPDKSLVN